MIALYFIIWIVIFIGLWHRQVTTQNATSVDVFWTLTIGCHAVACYLFFGSREDFRPYIVGLLALVWASRLSSHLYFGRVKHNDKEDARYAALRKRWGAAASQRFLVLYLIQVALTFLCAIPFGAAMTNTSPWSVFDWIGIVIGLISISGEALADKQLANHKKHSHEICKKGFWRYSRHPNYFFEWMYWWAYVFLAIGSPWFWLSLVGPVLMLFLLIKVTGVAPAERMSLSKRGEEYRRYQNETSMFVPWFPKQKG